MEQAVSRRVHGGQICGDEVHAAEVEVLQMLNAAKVRQQRHRELRDGVLDVDLPPSATEVTFTVLFQDTAAAFIVGPLAGPPPRLH